MPQALIDVSLIKDRQTATAIDSLAGFLAAAAVYNTNTATAGTTLTAANITGSADSVYLAMTGTLGGAANVQLPTVAALVAVLQANSAASPINQSYVLRIINAGAGAFAWTPTTNTGWTINAGLAATIPQNTWRDYIVTVTALTTATLQYVSTGTYT